MKTAKNLFNRLRSDETGASLVEYGLLVGLIAVVCIGAITLLGTSISELFGRVEEGVSTAGTAPGQ